jgi:hypothetical protein
VAEAPARDWRRNALRWGGLMLLALCVAYLAKALADLDLARLGAALGWREWLGTGICAVLYGACLLLLAQAWAKLAAGERKLALATVLAIYGPGTVAKYLPGSVFQYASRHVIGRRENLPHAAMARASLVEAAMHVGIALALAGALLATGGLWVPAAAAAAGVALLAWRAKPLATALACQLLFFAAFAAIVVVLGTFGALVDDPARLAGWFFVAWTAGFLVPIAPGGIGVREAAFLALAAPYEATGAIALLALLARLVGIVGDGLFGLAGYFAATRLARSNRHASA